MNIEKQMQQEIFIKNILTLLSTDKSVKIMEKKSFTNSVRELNIANDLLSQWTNSWKQSSNKILYLPGDAKEIQNMLLFLFSALLSDENPVSTAFDTLFAEFPNGNLDRKKGTEFIQQRTNLQTEKSFQKRIDLFKDKILLSSASIKNGSVNQKFYIANQVTYEGLDEIQRLLLAYKLGIHVAIDGPPGVGKTQSILEIGNILKKNVYTKTCSSRTTESHIISFPVLTVQEGVSVTAQENGPLVRAMLEGSIFYGDEFNLLKEDVQKRMNSAFDERSSIDRMDGMMVQAQKGFWGAISYNPTNNMVARDLEESVADRFLHLHYDRWGADFKALVASSKAKGTLPSSKIMELSYGIKLEWRGIGENLKFYRGEEANDGKINWFEFFTDAPAKDTPFYVYRSYDQNSIFQTKTQNLKEDLSNLATNAFSEQELARMISRFTELLISLSESGESPILKKIGLADLKEKEDLELLSLHESSTRIEVAALKHYHELINKGWNRYLAQSYSVRIVIDQICYGQFRNKKLRENTTYTLVNLIAKNMKLFADTSKYNTKMLTDSLLKQNG